ncbi:MAG: thiamine-phosphate pyrophosphorylase [Chloroflexota bacterium]
MAQSETSAIRRILDANLNRAGEGLRFLEELARLMLNDAALTQNLKNRRHEILRCDWQLQQEMLQARDSSGDVGVEMETPEQKEPRDLPAAAVANARRVQESLRVLEELAKLPSMKTRLDSDKFKRARFALYTLEQELVSRLTAAGGER